MKGGFQHSAGVPLAGVTYRAAMADPGRRPFRGNQSGRGGYSAPASVDNAPARYGRGPRNPTTTATATAGPGSYQQKPYSQYPQQQYQQQQQQQYQQYQQHPQPARYGNRSGYSGPQQQQQQQQQQREHYGSSAQHYPQRSHYYAQPPPQHYEQRRGGGGGGMGMGRGGRDSAPFYRDASAPTSRTLVGIPSPSAGHPPARTGFTYRQCERSLLDICRRHPRITLCDEFCGEICHWALQPPLAFPIGQPLTSIRFSGRVVAPRPPLHPGLAPPRAATPLAPPPPPPADTRYFVWVMLLTADATATTTGSQSGNRHLFQQIHFILSVDPNDVAHPLGGEWSAVEDGADPTDDATLIRTAIRHTQQRHGLDLTPCRQWTKFIELCYSGKDGSRNHTVVFVPDVWTHFCNPDTVAELSKFVRVDLKEESVLVEEQAPETPVPQHEEAQAETDAGEDAEGTEEKSAKRLRLEKVMKEVETVLLWPRAVSLHQLLVTDTAGKGVDTAELALFAAAFDEMLGERYAREVLVCLRRKRYEAQQIKLRHEEETRRKAALAAELARAELLAEEAQAQAKKESESNAGAEDEAMQTDHAAAESSGKPPASDTQEDAPKPAAIGQQPDYISSWETITIVDEATAAAFRYFDKPLGSGKVIHWDVLSRALFALGDVTVREVDNLMASAFGGTERHINYVHFCSKTERQEKRIPVQRNKAEPVSMEAEAEAEAPTGDATTGDATTADAETEAEAKREGSAEEQVKASEHSSSDETAMVQ
eukprot:TRINITY_DN18305_c0_g1_i1.p1 TRINITY_DN18305_c0_g1~~TRINITY_DN18305_c0_g1_i1.p1  ORF type:complete len:766 (-),score=149.46 TRINITY_DN18305_c0_g1_i1:368-2665(-)